ncbi:MAG: hypothetical protein KDD45_12240 [Bdellovibrionales bacterium]|nr:hypothetical protein [Bdellovibrionales bacterium]
MAHLNPNSIIVHNNSKIHTDLLETLTQEDRFQFERKGFYCLDKDSDLPTKKLIWNQIVSLVDRPKK